MNHTGGIMVVIFVVLVFLEGNEARAYISQEFTKPSAKQQKEGKYILPMLTNTSTNAELFIYEAGKLYAHDRAEGDAFGFSLDIDGDYMVIGDIGDDEIAEGAGAAYIFERSPIDHFDWIEVKKLTDINGSEWDDFGRTVAIDTDTAVIASPFGGSGGKALVFQQNQGGPNNWGLVKELLIPDLPFGSSFGSSVDVEGDTIAVGALGESDPVNGEYSGAVYIFYRNEGGANNWGMVKRIIASDGSRQQYFGTAVALQSDTLIVGASGDSENADHEGAAYVLERNHGGLNNWGEIKKIFAGSGPGQHIRSFGSNVDIKNDSILIGNNAADASETGWVCIFDRNYGGINNWGNVQSFTHNYTFGIDGAIEGKIVIIGSPKDPFNGYESGTTYIYKPSIVDQFTYWQFWGNLDAYDGDTNDYYGSAIE